MFRFILFAVCCVPITLLYSIRMIFASLLPGPSGPKGEHIGRLWAKALLRSSGLRLDVDLASLHPGRHYVFMVNHQSNLDIPVIYMALSTFPIRFVAKKSLFTIPIFGSAMHKAGHIPIDRKNRRSGMKSVQYAVEAARAGICPVIFPEGTRNSDLQKLLDFKIGGIVLALRCGLPVAPLILSGTGKAMPRGRMILTSTTIKIKALSPIDVSAFTLKQREQFRNYLYSTMSQAYTSMLVDLK